MALLVQWITEKGRDFDSFTHRVLEMETWQPVCEGVRHSTSVTDMFTMFHATMNAFFKLELRVPDFLNHLLENIVACNVTYSNLMTTHTPRHGHERSFEELGRSLIPVAPPKTRPSRSAEDVELARKKTSRGKPGGGGGMGPAGGSGGGTGSGGAHDPQIPEPPDVCIRMCNLFHARRQFGNLISDTAERFEQLMREKSISVEQRNMIENYRTAVTSAYDRAIEDLQRFLAIALIFHDMHDSFLGVLYLPRPADPGDGGGGLCPVLEDLEGLVDQLRDLLEPELIGRVVEELRTYSLQALRHAMLEGGPSRVFEASDAPRFAVDLSLLVGFFGQDASKPMYLDAVPEGCSVVGSCVRCERPLHEGHRASFFCVDCTPAARQAPSALGRLLVVLVFKHLLLRCSGQAW